MKKTGHLLLYNTALVIMMVGQICSQNAWHVAPIYPGSLQTDSTQSGPTIQSSHPMSIITTDLPFPAHFITQEAQNMEKCANSRQAFKNVWELFLPCHQSGNIKHKKRLYSYLGELESSFWWFPLPWLGRWRTKWMRGRGSRTWGRAMHSSIDDELASF